jgi:hypothetical protein
MRPEMGAAIEAAKVQIDPPSPQHLPKTDVVLIQQK